MTKNSGKCTLDNSFLKLLFPNWLFKRFAFVIDCIIEGRLNSWGRLPGNNNSLPRKRKTLIRVQNSNGWQDDFTVF